MINPLQGWQGENNDRIVFENPLYCPPGSCWCVCICICVCIVGAQGLLASCILALYEGSSELWELYPKLVFLLCQYNLVTFLWALCVAVICSELTLQYVWCGRSLSLERKQVLFSATSLALLRASMCLFKMFSVWVLLVIHKCQHRHCWSYI